MPDSKHHESNRTFYDRISHFYDAIADAGEHNAREAGETALNLQAGESVLEIGFGTGNSLVTFSDQVGDHGSVSGVDISPGMKDVAQKKLQERETVGNIELKVGDARELPFDDESFDAVFSSFTLELFPVEHISIVLREVARVLKPDGRMGIVSMSVVRKGKHASLLESTYIWMHRHFPHIVDCQPIDVHKHVINAGMKIASEDEVEIWTMPVAVAVAMVG